MSSKRRLRRKVCEGKIRHASADAASIERRKLLKRTLDTSRIDVYPCPFCNGYHIGHSKGSGLKRS